jgi:hypothetical protein
VFGSIEQYGFMAALLAILIAIAFALGKFGESKGYPFWTCFICGIFLSPLTVWIVLCLLPDRPRPARPMPLEMVLEIEKAKLAKAVAAAQGAGDGQPA